jgi:tetratricopeptide (TPR) repeat protein
MNGQINPQSNEVTASPAIKPRSNRFTCIIVLGVALLIGMVVAVGLYLTVGRNLLSIFHESRGTIYYEQGNLDRAISEFDQAILLNPDFVEAYVQRGLVYDFKGDVDYAIDDFDKAIQLDPDFRVAYTARGCAYLRKGDLGRAIVDFDKAINLEPNFPGSYYGRGLAYFYQGKYDLAITDFNQTITLAPSFTGGLLPGGHAIRLKKAARRCRLRQVQEQYPDNAAALIIVAGHFSKWVNTSRPCPIVRNRLNLIPMM